MCTGPGSTNENIRENRLVKLHFLCQGVLLDIFSGSGEVNERTIPWIKQAKIQTSSKLSKRYF